ncbi:MAG TPA: hypothetical protein VFZ12_02490 [Dehalococcoidia bacterium]|nr:hypothetical protein [Dehalococcoidia bacterium]
MSDKSWDADADIGSGRLDFGGKVEDLGDQTPRLPDSQADPDSSTVPESQQDPDSWTVPEAESTTGEIPAGSSESRRVAFRLPWVVLVVVLATFAWPIIAIVTALISAIDDISDPAQYFETDTVEVTPNANFGFLRTLDAAMSGAAGSLPQCFFAEASSQTCTSTYDALASLVDSTSTTIECSGYRAFWVNSLRQAGDGNSANLEALYSDDAGAYPFGYAEARTRCVGGD